VLLVCAPPLGAQPAPLAPTVSVARSAFAPMLPIVPTKSSRQVAPCGHALKNGALLGLGLALAVASLEVVYTLIRAPLVNSGHDVPRADPMLIAYAGVAGFAIGLIGTEICRR
jgi:hypothetical protein